MARRGDQSQVVYVDGDVPQLPIQLGQLLVDSSLISPGTTNLQQCTSQDPLTYEPLQGGYPILALEVGVVDTNYYYGDGRRYGVTADGVTNDCQAVQNTFDSSAAEGFPQVLFPSGTIRILNPRTDNDYTCAVVVRNLRNCIVRGVKDTVFYLDSGGVGAAEFGLFRYEQCEDIETCYFKMDGSGIPLDGTGSNRSRGIVAVNYDVNNVATDLTANTGLEFHHIHAHHIGGLLNVPPRNETLDPVPYTDRVKVYLCRGTEIQGQDHFVGLAYVRNGEVLSSRAENPLTLTAQIGNLFCDASAGCENILVENNTAIGFTGGCKAETHINTGPGSNEDRVSKNVRFVNNSLLEIGDPITLIDPSPGGGGWYGIKLNGVNHSAINNTITARTTNVSTGGLYQGINLTSTAVTPVDSVQTCESNTVTGTVLGINHDDTAADTGHAYITHIRKNKVYDTVIPGSPIASNDGTGIITSKNVFVEDNWLVRTAYSAISMNAPDQTIARNNIAFNCSSTDHAVAGARVVFSQEDAGSVGYFEFSNNTILDDRGASGSEYGYFLRAGTTYTNKYLFSPGLVNVVLTAVAFDKYFSYQGTSLALDGAITVNPRTIYATGIPSGTAPWSGMAWRVGDRAVNTTPAVGQPKAWSCTVAGTPGTWVSEGNL